MKKPALALGMALALAVPLPAIAADLHTPHQGTACPEGDIGTWHFVNNQTRGAGPGLITVTFDNTVVVQGPTAVNRNVQHFWIEDTGHTLLDASTNLPGRLVLSEYRCEKKGGPG